MSEPVSQATIASIISNACRTFCWGKKRDSWQTMLSLIRDIAMEEFGLSLADLEIASSKLASEMTREQYDTVMLDYNWKDDPSLHKDYNSIPFIFSVDRDGLVTVVFNTAKRLPNCDIQEITTEMMELVKYLGLVRMYIPADTEFNIPYFPDNIIHLEINKLDVVNAIDTNGIPFPQFLRGFIDEPEFTNAINANRNSEIFTIYTYTSRLPPTLFKLETVCNAVINLPPSLIYYKRRIHSIDVGFCLPEIDSFPIGIKNVELCFGNFINCDNECGKVRCSSGLVKCPWQMDFLKIPIGHILTDRLIFGNIRTLYISHFYNWVPKCKFLPSDYTGNMIFKNNFLCGNCHDNCEGYEHATKVILEDSVENLILNFHSSLNFLELIEYVPPKFNLIINGVDSSLFRSSKVLGFDLTMGKLPELPIGVMSFVYQYTLKSYSYMTDFQKKFPQVSITLNERK